MAGVSRLVHHKKGRLPKAWAIRMWPRRDT